MEIKPPLGKNIFTFRRLDEKDAPAFCQIRAESTLNAPEWYKLTPREIADISHEVAVRLLTSIDNIMVGAFVKNNLVAMRRCSFFNSEKLQHRGLLWELCAKNTYHDFFSLGRDLTAETIQYIQQTRPLVEQIRTAIVTTNAVSREIIEALGFQLLWTEKQAFKYNDAYHDLHHFVKYLK